MLLNDLLIFVGEVRQIRFAAELVLGGSFVTAVDKPNDIDALLVLRGLEESGPRLKPHEYNVVSRKRVSKRFALDLFVARDGDDNHRFFMRFFRRVRGNDLTEKGVLRVMI
jgi:hypothetical protein